MSIGRFGALLLILLALAGTFVYYPSAAGSLARVVFILGLAASVISIVRSQLRQHRAGQLERRTFIFNCIAEITGVLLILGLSILLGRAAMLYIIGQIQGIWGLALGLLAAAVCGLAMSALVRTTWGRLVKRSAP